MNGPRCPSLSEVEHRCVDKYVVRFDAVAVSLHPGPESPPLILREVFGMLVGAVAFFPEHAADSLAVKLLAEGESPRAHLGVQLFRECKVAHGLGADDVAIEAILP